MFFKAKICENCCAYFELALSFSRQPSRLPEQVLEEVGDWIVPQSGAAVERELDPRRSGKTAGARIEYHDARLDVAGQERGDADTGAHRCLDPDQAATLERGAPATPAAIELLNRSHPPFARMAEQHQRQRFPR